jgi:HEAT repeat protein
MTRFALLWVVAMSSLVLAPSGTKGDDKDEPTFRGKKAMEWVEILRNDKEPKRRRAALIALSAFGPKTRAVIPAVAESLRKDESEDLRAAAAQMLGRILPLAAIEKLDVREGVEALTDALRADKADKVREAAAAALGKAGGESRPAVQALAAALKDKHAGTTAAAAESLASMGESARAAAPALVETLKDQNADRFARGFAAIALVRIGGPETGLAAPALTATLADAKAPVGVRETSARLLGQLDSDAVASVPTLARALEDSAVEIRRAAAGSLAQLGPLAKDALPQLKRAVEAEKDRGVRCSAIYALGGLGKDAAPTVGLLAKCVKENHVEVRLAAIRALGNIGPAAVAAVDPTLLEAARESQKDVREAALDAIKKIQSPESKPSKP